MNLAVITPAYYQTEEPYKLLRDSCAAHHLPLYPFGQGQPWRGDSVAHFEGALEAVANLPSIYDFIMFTDAGDTFVMGGADEIQSKFHQYRCDFLMSAQQSLYPWGLEGLWDSSRDARPEIPGPWNYLNGGGWIARREKAIEVLTYTRDHAEGAEAQWKWISAYCSGKFNFQLDHRCDIFQTMSEGSSGILEVSKRRVVNTATGSTPVVAHYNGRLGGIEELWKEIYT